jgi:hypothetical protein
MRAGHFSPWLRRRILSLRVPGQRRGSRYPFPNLGGRVMESRDTTTLIESMADGTSVPAMAEDSTEEVAAEAASVRRFFGGDNVSMMGGWT